MDFSDYQELGFQSTSHSLRGKQTVDWHPQMVANTEILEVKQHCVSYTGAASFHAPQGSTFISTDDAFETGLLENLGMLAPARVPQRPDSGAVGELPIGDAILPLLACVCVYVAMRVRRVQVFSQFLKLNRK